MAGLAPKTKVHVQKIYAIVSVFPLFAISINKHALYMAQLSKEIYMYYIGFEGWKME